MTPSNETSVLVLAVEANPACDLLRIAVRNGWSVRQAASATAGHGEILRDRPVVAVIQVSRASGEDLELIRLARTGPLPVSVVAVATEHHEEIERAVRIAGVDGYLGDAADAALLERTVAELLARHRNDKAPVLRTGRRGIHEPNNLLLLSSSMQEPRVAGTPTPPPIREGGWHEYLKGARRGARRETQNASHHKGAGTWSRWRRNPGG